MSKAMSARYGVACPTCGVAPNEPCRARKSKRVTDTHAARIAAAYPACVACGLQRQTHPVETCRQFVSSTWAVQ